MEKDWIIITEGGWGTWPENIGCVCQVVKWKENGMAVISTGTLIKQDGDEFHDEFHDLYPKGFRLAEPHEIPYQEPTYEIY